MDFKIAVNALVLLAVGLGLGLRCSALEIRSFVMTATPPSYTGPDLRDPDFTNCMFESFTDFAVPNPNAPDGINVHDDHTGVLRSVRDQMWWRDSLMALSGNLGQEVANRGAVHWDNGQGEFPEILSMFEDGGFRPVMALNVPPTSTIRIGPLELNEERNRQFADVGTVEMLPDGKTLKISYETGGEATITILEATPSISRFRVDLDYAVGANRNVFELTSMFRDSLSNDVALIETIDADGIQHKVPVLEYAGGEVRQIAFLREEYSEHNSLGPNLTLSDFILMDEQGQLFEGTIHTTNESFDTDCAEVDNVVIGFSPQVVPEPSSWLLLIVAVAILAIVVGLARCFQSAVYLRRMSASCRRAE